MESTYGDRDHKDENLSVDELGEAIAYSYGKSEKVIIPAFAVERTQEVLYCLHMRHCTDPAAPGWSGIGCAEALAHLQGRLSLEDCRSLWLRNTRAYAKRQLTWFRARPEAQWLPPDDPTAVVKAACRFWQETRSR